MPEHNSRGVVFQDRDAMVTSMDKEPCSRPFTWSPLLSDPISNVIELNKKDVVEVEEALASFKTRGLDGDEVNCDNFPLPNVQALLEKACRDIHEGPGFVIIRGLDPVKHGPEDNINLFLGIASYIGDIRGTQDRRGNVLTHITDSKNWCVPRELRHGIHTNTGLTWHTDMGADVLALQVRSLAKEGGDTLVASSWTIYQELLESHPEAVKVLSEPWRIQTSANPPKFTHVALLEVHLGKIYISVDPGRLGLHPVTAKTKPGLNASISDLSDQQLAALEILSKLAAKHAVRLDTKPGDLVFINNWSIMHAREAYVDPQDGPGRHLVRLWLRNSKFGWPIPPSMQAPWKRAYGPKGDGNPGAVKLYQIEPAPVYHAPRYTAGSAAFMIEDSDDVNGVTGAFPKEDGGTGALDR